MTEESKTTVIYAGFWVRVGAFVLDYILVSIIALPLFIWFALQYWEDVSPGVVFFAFPFIWYFFSLFYFIGYWVWCGQTPGKIAAGIKVVGSNGRPIGIGRAVLRYLVGYSIYYVLSYIPFIVVAFQKQKRGVHDLIANTYVIMTG
ncbi:MAG: RDD family protein [Dehalococcoidia bacterium]|nr:RDD family protein [Dehalococcoidia bacterium]